MIKALIVALMLVVLVAVTSAQYLYGAGYRGAYGAYPTAYGAYGGYGFGAYGANRYIYG